MDGSSSRPERVSSPIDAALPRSSAGGSLAPGALVVGIDPGTRVLGYGAVRVEPRGAKFVTAGVFQPPASLALPERLARIAIGLDELMAELRPTVVAVERAFGGKNVQSALRLGEARGVALAAAARVDARVVELAPAEAKRMVVGSGAADKEQVAAMVLRQLGLTDPGGPRDATDALAVALAHVLADRSVGLRTAARPRRG
ncbi:MAG: crossover junction endodeoxyribonuclease RuvC [Planctomycetota bacterium]|jgi:crossover junction endodeoxyribonuclease RuvC